MDKLIAIKEKVQQHAREFAKKNAEQINTIGKAVTLVGGFVPIFGTPIQAFGATLGYIADLAEKEADKAEAIDVEFRELEEHMKIIASTLEGLKKETKDTSQVVNEMKIIYIDIQKWAALIKSGKPPPNLADSLKRKNARLSKVLHAETWLNVMKMAETLEQLVKVQIRDSKEVYGEGKMYYAQKNYVEAQKSFLEYRRLLEAGSSPVETDHSEDYLWLITEEINKIALKNADVFLTAPVLKNKYQKPKTLTSPTSAPTPSSPSSPSTPSTGSTDTPIPGKGGSFSVQSP